MVQNWAQNKNQRPFKTWNTACHRVSTNRNSAQSPKVNAITVFGLRLYKSLPNFLGDIESVKTEKFTFELSQILQLIPDEPKI